MPRQQKRTIQLGLGLPRSTEDPQTERRMRAFPSCLDLPRSMGLWRARGEIERALTCILQRTSIVFGPHEVICSSDTGRHRRPPLSLLPEACV